MMDKRVIMALTPIILGVILFSYFTFRLWYTWVTLPPWSWETEGRHVGFGLLLIIYLYIAPLSCSLCLAGFLIYPAFFERIYMLVRAIAALLLVGGLGVIALVIGYIILEWSIYLLVLLGIMPIWALPILAYLTYTRANKASFIETPEIPEAKDSKTGSLLSLIGGAFMITSQIGIAPMVVMLFLSLIRDPMGLGFISLDSAVFILMFSLIPIIVGVVVLFASFTASGYDARMGSMLAIIFGIPSFFGLSSLPGSIIALVGGCIGLHASQNQV
jgi:hypothetical protein